MLHVRHLPDFDGRLSGHHSELLVSYLTAPYLRIPLVLRLLSDESRVRALASPELQGVLDSVLFEPGQWRPPRRGNRAPCPLEQIPAPFSPTGRGDHLATPHGLLINELTKSPEATFEAVARMMETSVEMDTGRFGSSSAEVSHGTHNAPARAFLPGLTSFGPPPPVLFAQC